MLISEGQKLYLNIYSYLFSQLSRSLHPPLSTQIVTFVCKKIRLAFFSDHLTWSLEMGYNT